MPTGRVAGKVALVTGAARGIGRAHAVRLAEEGADLVLGDICADVPEVAYALADDSDLGETARLVREAGRQVIAEKVDVRDQGALDRLVERALAELGRIDIVVANAGVVSFAPAWELTEEQWAGALDVLLSGAWRSAKAALPAMIEAGRGGSVVVIGSANGTRPARNLAQYVSAKHGLVGLTRALALEVAEHEIRANLVAPGSVATEMAGGEAMRKRMRPDLENPTVEDVTDILRERHALPVPWVEPVDVANATLWLVSDEARFVTGAVIPVDAGFAIK